MNICVRRSYGRQGIGRQLLRHWIARMIRQGMGELTLEVRRSNRAAQALYLSEGFVHVGSALITTRMQVSASPPSS